jgi:hypothetical protein
MKSTIILFAFLLLFSTTGADCINDFVASINVRALEKTVSINPGNNPNFADCITVEAKEYLDPNFDDIKDARVYDIEVTTIGTYSGNVLNGRVMVNGVQILGYSGSWAAFNTPQSLLRSPLITRWPGGILALVNAIKNKQDIFLCGDGSVSDVPVPAGLSVKFEILAQVDAQP